ncbi:hypothetical protein HK405_013201, partial [Cladochytrium tenue]
MASKPAGPAASAGAPGPDAPAPVASQDQTSPLQPHQREHSKVAAAAAANAPSRPPSDAPYPPSADASPQHTSPSQPPSPAAAAPPSAAPAAASPAVAPGVLAGIARTVASRAAVAAAAAARGFVRAFARRAVVAAGGFARGALRWWFRPTRMFKPGAVNPMIVFKSMAEAEGKKASGSYVRSVMQKEGFQVWSKNMLPLMICNSIVGALLFNVYSRTLSRLDARTSSSSDHHAASTTTATTASSRAAAPLHPFLAGGVAGLAQGFLATPIENVTRRVNPEDMIARRGEGVIALAVRAVKEAMPPPLPRPTTAAGGGKVDVRAIFRRAAANSVNRVRFFYDGLTFNVAKDVF